MRLVSIQQVQCLQTPAGFTRSGYTWHLHPQQGKLEQTSSFSMLNCPTALSVFLLFLSVVEGLALQACLPLFHVRCLLLCSTATAAVAAEVLQEPAMDLSATFRQSMRFNLQGEHSLWDFLGLPGLFIGN